MNPHYSVPSRRPNLAAAVAVLAVALSGCGVPGPGGPVDTYGLDLALGKDTNTNGAIVFFVDGLNAEIFRKMLEGGELPAIEKHFADRGLYAPHAVANTPSVTLANLTSFATGLYPGHHGVVGVNWFDRNGLIWRDYETIAQKNTLDGDYVSANIYEQFPDRTTFSVFFQPHRHATKFVENWTSAGPPFFFGWYEFVDRLTLWRLNIVADVARTRGEWPAVTIAYMLAPDFRAYASGVSSAEYREALKHTDRQIGRVCGDLSRAGLLDSLYLVLVSDHGLGEVTRHFPLDEFLRGKAGLRIAPRRLWEKTPFEKRLEYYRRFPAVTYGSGDRYWAICLRKPVRGEGGVAGYEPWPVRPNWQDMRAYPLAPKSRGPAEGDLIDMLLSSEAVDAVAHAAGTDRVRLCRKAGQVEFRQPDGPGGPISYHLISGDDPLGWRGRVPKKWLTGRPVGPRQWLEATAATDYPDLPAQILAYFRAPRAGDLAVFAAPGWDFGRANRAGHGGLRPEDLHVPLLLAGPGIEPRRIDAARTVDVMPTLLELLGRDIPPGLDGKSLIQWSGQ